jgi:hypothetical protein
MRALQCDEYAARHDKEGRDARQLDVRTKGYGQFLFSGV